MKTLVIKVLFYFFNLKLLKNSFIIDLCAAGIGLLQEMTDLESSEESIDNIKTLVDYLVINFSCLCYGIVKLCF
jgi:hypothetical protein